ncbi:hypothetical protein DUI87_22330 [Hirundo rustica rustica]|uniref:Uncharacterized protein n=1 Tax=Hirundo rustica rustica TaxID=333673 RepID=A0A3M0JJB7_HIRRU|nr:hypothetical protein DUI87_22330 [Hirundo rustica rustica]
MEGMGTLQAGMPLSTMLPVDWPVLIVDLKDCFFMIPLHPDDRPKFAFTVPTINNAKPAQRYQWRVLRQGMRNSRCYANGTFQFDHRLCLCDIAQRLVVSVLKEVSNPALFDLLKALWCAIQARVHPYYVLHVRSHTNLPGFVAEGNTRADKLANPAWVAPQPDVLTQAKTSHGFFHQNAHALQKQFQLTATEANEIVELCDDCHTLGAPLLAGVNPRGLKALELWQTDITQVAEFGRLKYVHITVDTFSSVMWASAHTGEKARYVTAHWRQAFAVLGIPSAVKTDNGPAYTSQQASQSQQQPRAKVRVRNLVTKQWEGPYDLIAMGRGYACVSTDTGTRWLPSKCVRPDLRQRQNSADRQGGSHDQLESHQGDESSSDHSDDSSADSD